jgi:hypothetical protein
MISLQEIDFPHDCTVVYHEFYNYDPVNEYNASDREKYLSEDLLQCYFKEESILIDVGWYADTDSANGEFRIQIIQHENWEIPLNVIYSKSSEEVKDILDKILDYYSYSKEEDFHSQDQEDQN